jgi:hypothetical protein
VAEIVYVYEVEGSTYSGFNEKPFISPNSAENYAAGFVSESALVVRLKPGRPEISVSATKIRPDSGMDKDKRYDFGFQGQIAILVPAFEGWPNQAGSR